VEFAAGVGGGELPVPQGRLLPAFPNGGWHYREPNELRPGAWSFSELPTRVRRHTSCSCPKFANGFLIAGRQEPALPDYAQTLKYPRGFDSKEDVRAAIIGGSMGLPIDEAGMCKAMRSPISIGEEEVIRNLESLDTWYGRYKLQSSVLKRWNKLTGQDWKRYVYNPLGDMPPPLFTVTSGGSCRECDTPPDKPSSLIIDSKGNVRWDPGA
jgi:hypothetical protein